MTKNSWWLSEASQWRRTYTHTVYISSIMYITYIFIFFDCTRANRRWDKSFFHCDWQSDIKRFTWMSSSECGFSFISFFVDVDAIFCGWFCFAFSTLPSTVLYLIYVTTIHRINSNKWMCCVCFFVCVFLRLNFSHWSKDLRIIYFCSAIENEAKLSRLIYKNLPSRPQQ